MFAPPLAVNGQIAMRPDWGQRLCDHARLGDVDDLVERVMVINRRLVGMARKGESAAAFCGHYKILEAS